MASKTDFLSEYIAKRVRTHQQRTLREISVIEGITIISQNKCLLNFSSNNYIGLAGHSALKQRAIDFICRYGVGSTASRLVCGNFTCHAQVETKLAALMGTEAALLFNSGFQANTTIIPTLLDRQSLVVADKSCHNSILRGALASSAKTIRYRHNDLQHLECILKKANAHPYSRKLIVTESLFSMEGDCSDISALCSLAEKYAALLYIDDAHANGIMGINGMGLVACRPGIDIALGTFGKGAGSFGAYVACSREMREYLIQACPGLLYTTALPPSVVGAIDAALDLIPHLEEERATLWKNAAYVRNMLQNLGFNIGKSTTHIIPIVMGEEMAALELSKWLEQQGILAIAIRPPTVPHGSSIVRLCVSSLHKLEHLQQLQDALQGWVDMHSKIQDSNVMSI